MYLTVSGYGTGHVFRSIDSGANWTDISSNLPNIPTSAFLIDPLVATTLYAGTDIGLFRSTDNGANWLPFNNGLPPVPIMEFASQPNGFIQIATYGRGAYELPPPNTPTVNVANATAGERGTGNSPTGEGTIDFEISLTQASSRAVTVLVSTNSLTAVEGEDFTGVEDLEVVFPPNTVTRTVSIPTIEDPGDEPDETFALDVTGASNAVVGDGEGIGTIIDDDMPSATGRNIRVVNVSTQPGHQVTLALQLDAQGNESSASFTANFDPAILSSPVAIIGTGAPTDATLATNPSQTASGRLGILVNSTGTFAQGVRQIATIRFNVAANAATGPTTITFGGTPTAQAVFTTGGAVLPTTYQSGTIQVSAAQAGVEITGRVLSPDEERGIRNTVVTMTSSTGVRRTSTTSSFGVYRFDDVLRGETYVLSVTSRRYRFATRILTVTDSVADFDFVGLE